MGSIGVPPVVFSLFRLWTIGSYSITRVLPNLFLHSLASILQPTGASFVARDILSTPMKALVYDISPTRWICSKLASFVSSEACFGSLSGLRMRDLPRPELPGPDWVRLKTILGGVCGTDLALLLLRNHPCTILQQFARFPAVLGHENVATVDAVGSDVSGWEIGQRVCADPALGCEGRGIDPPCAQCSAGRSSVCESPGDRDFPPRALLGINGKTGGSWSDYFLAHQSQLHAVPNDVPDEIAVLVDPIASTAHAVLRRRPADGESILVNGSGIIALGVIGSIRALGHENTITAVVRHPFQERLAREMGATRVLRMPRSMRRIDRYRAVAKDTHGHRLDGRLGNQALLGGYDLTYECTGTGPGFGFALSWTRARGTVVAVGTTGITMLDTTPIWFDEQEVIGASGRQIEDLDGRTRHTYEIVLDWIAEGRLDLSKLSVRRFPLEQYRTALSALTHRSRIPIIKAVFDPHGTGNR